MKGPRIARLSGPCLPLPRTASPARSTPVLRLHDAGSPALAARPHRRESALQLPEQGSQVGLRLWEGRRRSQGPACTGVRREHGPWGRRTRQRERGRLKGPGQESMESWLPGLWFVPSPPYPPNVVVHSCHGAAVWHARRLTQHSELVHGGAVVRPPRQRLRVGEARVLPLGRHAPAARGPVPARRAPGMRPRRVRGRVRGATRPARPNQRVDQHWPREMEEPHAWMGAGGQPSRAQPTPIAFPWAAASAGATATPQDVAHGDVAGRYLSGNRLVPQGHRADGRGRRGQRPRRPGRPWEPVQLLLQLCRQNRVEHKALVHKSNHRGIDLHVQGGVRRPAFPGESLPGRRPRTAPPGLPPKGPSTHAGLGSRVPGYPHRHWTPGNQSPCHEARRHVCR